jgi:hypothetical protein
MTQTNGLDVLLAWAGFAVLIGALAWLLLRRHASPGAAARDEPRRPARPQPQGGPTRDCGPGIADSSAGRPPPQ